MPALKSENSGVDSKRSLLNGGACASPGPVVFGFRPSAMLSHLFFPGQLSIRQSASDNLFHANHEAVEVVRLAVVKAKCLFVNVAKQVERFDGNVGTMKATLQQAPEVLDSICVHLIVNVVRSDPPPSVQTCHPCAKRKRTHRSKLCCLPEPFQQPPSASSVPFGPV